MPGKPEVNHANSSLPILSTIITSIGFCPQNPRDKTGVTAAVTPVLYPFEQVIAASKQLLYGVRPDRGLSFWKRE